MALDLNTSDVLTTSSKARKAALTPNLYGALAMWDLLYDAGGNVISGHDRSGNGRDIGATNPIMFPDLIPGRQCEWTGGAYGGAENNGHNNAGFWGADLKRPDFTVTARVVIPAYTGGGGFRTIFGLAQPGSNVEFLFGQNLNGLATFWQFGGGHTGVDAQSAYLKKGDGQQHFVSCRRALDYSILIGADKSYGASTGPLTPPDATGGFGGVCVGVGTQPGNVNNYCGAIIDLCVWPGVLTDAQINTLNAIAMGL